MKTLTRPFILLLLIGMTTVVFTNCERYDDGGLFSRADYRLKTTWKLDKYFRNGNNETSSLLISSFNEEYKDDGSYIRSYKDKDNDPVSETGSWQFDSEKHQVNVFGIGSIELTDETSTVSASDYDILRLKDDEYWYFFENGGDLHEFQLVPD